MVVKPVAGDEDVVRYAGPQDYDAGLLSSAAFLRLEKDEDGLSVNRCGMLVPGDADADLHAIRTIMVSRGVPVDGAGCFARLNVDAVHRAARKARAMFRVVATPSKGHHRSGRLDNPAHATIEGLPMKGTALGSLTSRVACDILLEQVLEEHPGWP